MYYQKNKELTNLDHVADSRDCETVGVKERRFSRIVYRYGLMFVMIGKDINERGWRIDDASRVHSLYDLLTGS